MKETVTMADYFKAKVEYVGEEADLMWEEKMVILFNNTVPQDLKDIAIVHEGGSLAAPIEEGDVMMIGDTSFTLLFVGDKANETMTDLGHATFHFNGSATADQPGTICLEDKEIPVIEPGMTITFRKK